MDEEEDRKSGFHVSKEGGFVGISQYVIIAKELLTWQHITRYNNNSFIVVSER